MEGIKLIGMFFLALLGTIEAAEAPQVYQHTLRVKVEIVGPSSLQPVMAALGGIAVNALSSPAFLVERAETLPQPGEYDVALALAIIPMPIEVGEPTFEVGVSWILDTWCEEGHVHRLAKSPLLQTEGTAATVLPRAGRLLQDGARRIHEGILELDNRFIEVIRSEVIET